MEISILNKINTPIECCMLFESKATADRDIYPYLHALIEKNGENAVLKNWLYAIMDIGQYVLKNVNIDPQKLKFYFDCGAEVESNATALTTWAGGSASQLAELLLPDAIDTGAISTPAEFVEAMEQMDISAEQRWNKMQIFCSPHKYASELAEILAPAIALFKEKLPLFEPLLEQCCQQLEKAVLPENRNAFFAKIHLTPEEGSQIIFSPFITIPSGVIFLGAISHSAVMQVNYGVLFDELVVFEQELSDNSEVLYKLLQVIADKRRLEILRALKLNKMCGQDLAKLLSLTPATISHHMNSLMQCGLIDIEKQGARLIYSMSTHTIETLIERLKKAFL